MGCSFLGIVSLYIRVDVVFKWFGFVRLFVLFNNIKDIMDAVVVVVVVFATVLVLCSLYGVWRARTCGMKIVERVDGAFEWLALDKEQREDLMAWFSREGLKTIDMSTVVVQEYRLRVMMSNGGVGVITVPVGYCSDGVSKPLRGVLPVPHDREGGYWVFHDWMYQRQAWDDGTEITKEEADDLMAMLVLGEMETLWHPYKLLYRGLVEWYKKGDVVYRTALKERGIGMMVDGGGISFVSDRRGAHPPKERTWVPLSSRSQPAKAQ